MAKKTNLTGTTGGFSNAMEKGFAIVTVMNAKVYDALETEEYKALTPYDIANAVVGNTVSVKVGSNDVNLTEKLAKPLCTIDTLKVANVSQEGPSKTVTGGQYVNPLIKFGKTARLEMQDALGRIEAIEALGGGVAEWDEEGTSTTKVYTGLHFGSEFSSPKLIVGESFILDRDSKQVKVNVIFYQFSPDSIFNLTQDAEGDATVFDMNGDLLTTDIKITDKEGKDTTRGMFYSIVAQQEKVTE